MPTVPTDRASVSWLYGRRAGRIRFFSTLIGLILSKHAFSSAVSALLFAAAFVFCDLLRLASADLAKCPEVQFAAGELSAGLPIQAKRADRCDRHRAIATPPAQQFPLRQSRLGRGTSTGAAGGPMAAILNSRVGRMGISAQIMLRGIVSSIAARLDAPRDISTI